MVVVDASVYHPDDVRAGASSDVPGRNGTDVSSRRARCAEDGLARIPQSPKLREARVVGNQVGIEDIVRLGVFHVGPGGEFGHQLGSVLASRVKPKHADVTYFHGNIHFRGLLSLQDGLHGNRPELHEHFVGRHLFSVEELDFVLALKGKG